MPIQIRPQATGMSSGIAVVPDNTRIDLLAMDIVALADARVTSRRCVLVVSAFRRVGGLTHIET